MVLENLKYFSKKLANGKNKSAIKNAKNKGDKMVCPSFAKKPSSTMLMSTKANFT